MTTGAVDYAASYFKYKTPTPIQGAPTNFHSSDSNRSCGQMPAVSNQTWAEVTMVSSVWCSPPSNTR